MRKSRALPDNALTESRKYLSAALKERQYVTGKEPEMVMQVFDQTVEDLHNILDSILGSDPEKQALRVAFVHGVLVEWIEGMTDISGISQESFRPFTVAGRVAAAVSPEKAKLMLQAERARNALN